MDWEDSCKFIRGAPNHHNQRSSAGMEWSKKVKAEWVWVSVCVTHITVIHSGWWRLILIQCKHGITMLNTLLLDKHFIPKKHATHQRCKKFTVCASAAATNLNQKPGSVHAWDHMVLFGNKLSTRLLPVWCRNGFRPLWILQEKDGDHIWWRRRAVTRRTRWFMKGN